MYENYNDYELLSYISENNEEANNILFKKYEPLIISTSQRVIKYMEGSGVDLNDLIQEGRIGLCSAIDTFKESKETLFFTYAKTCIERKIYDLLKSTKTSKHKILNNSVPIEIDNEFGETLTFDYMLKDDKDNPEKLLLNEEQRKEFYKEAYDKLTDLEVQVFDLKMSGFDNAEISEILGFEYKKVDNTLQRIRTKLKDIQKSI